MFSWLRKIRIRGIKVLGLEIGFIHPDGTIPPASPPQKSAGSNNAKPCTPPPGATFTVRGSVIKTRGRDLGIRARNDAQLRAFWKANRIDTKLDWFGPGAPVISIGRSEDIERCKAGDEASLTFVVEDKSDGKRRIKTIDFCVNATA